ncbi:hypothetical protein [Maledivibacter halophilus]|uniref:Uncharacterized protein n=1 Tax=Maledivibacter halophilus TaxID=36842 RepID=A0A1T5LPH9_9FIRM|nr:hypothetical protein [Maledivibacter halophilus]SKC77852.1 hypothetical protein SAMN02194393_03194 [Maledivibacter halophilus]
MTIDKENTKLLKAIEELANPTSKDKTIIKEAVDSFGINTFLLNIEEYDISMTVKDKIIALRNVVDALYKGESNDSSQGGGQSG